VKKFKACLLVMLFLIVSLFSFSQEKKKPKGSIRFDFTVPQAVSNKAFRKSFTGVYDLSFSGNVGFGNFFVGGMYRMTQFQVPANKIAGISTLQNIINGAVKTGYDVMLGDRSILTFSLAGGYNWIYYTRVTCLQDTATGTRATAINLMPSVNINFLIDEGFGIGGGISYNILAYEFNPEYVCFQEFKPYRDGDEKGLTGTISFGFSAYYVLGKRAKKEY
jgi:hypothetical protein